jgi:hypothetical protein
MLKNRTIQALFILLAIALAGGLNLNAEGASNLGATSDALVPTDSITQSIAIDANQAFALPEPKPSPVCFTFTEPVREGIGTAHQILGWATVALGAATGILNPSLGGYPAHEALGWTAAGLSLTCMGTGIFAYGDEIFNLDMGWSIHQTHALLGAVGGALMLIAPFTTSSRAHQYVGEAGVACMAGALVLDLIW